MELQATSLGCSHRFCKLFIEEWMKVKKECPMCRAAITSKMGSIVRDSYIDKMVKHLSDELKKRRQELVQSRKAGDSGHCHSLKKDDKFEAWQFHLIVKTICMQPQSALPSLGNGMSSSSLVTTAMKYTVSEPRRTNCNVKGSIKQTKEKATIYKIDENGNTGQPVISNNSGHFLPKI